MAPSASPDTGFPLLTLLPVTDDRHAWPALILALADRTDGDFLVKVFGELGLGQALGTLTCIVPLDDPAVIDEDHALALPAESIVLLIPLERCTDPASGPELERLRGHGFRLMADGVPVSGQALTAGIGAVSSGRIAPLSPALSRLSGPHLATGVESPPDLAQCRSAGYGWFAGDYPLHPEQGATQQDINSRMLLLKLLGMVTSDTHTHDIEALLKQDPSLSYHLLKLVNSVSFALTTKITSFGYAIILLGRRQMQRWLQLLLYAQQTSGSGMSPLLARAALRGSLMEALCQKIGGSRDDQEHAFMTGIFSLLDVLFGMPLEQIVTPLHLADEVEDALLSHSGWLGGLLTIVEQSEHAPVSALGEQLSANLLTPESYCQAQVQACQWAIQVSRET